MWLIARTTRVQSQTEAVPDLATNYTIGGKLYYTGNINKENGSQPKYHNVR